MSGTAPKRLQKEYSLLEKKPQEWLTVALKDDQLFEWVVTITGPSGTPYEGGKFKILVKIPDEYPFKPPTLTFDTQIYHPNVKQPEGSMCFEMITQDAWAPELKIVQVLEEVYELFKKPNPNNPLDPAAAELFVKNKDDFNKAAKESTKKYAM